MRLMYSLTLLLLLCFSASSSASPTYMVETEIEFDQNASLSLGQIDAMYFFWELFEDPRSPNPISEMDIRTWKIIFRNSENGLPIQGYQDIVKENSIVQPIGGQARAANGLSFECFGTPDTCLPIGDLVVNNDRFLAQANSNNGDKTIHVDIPLGGIRLNTNGNFSFGEIFLSEYQNGSQIGTTQVIQNVRVSSAVVPLPAAFWLLSTAILGLVWRGPNRKRY